MLAFWKPGKTGKWGRTPTGTPPSPPTRGTTEGRATQGGATPTSLLANLGEATGRGIGCAWPPCGDARNGPDAKSVRTESPQAEAGRTGAQRRVREPGLPGSGSVVRVVHTPATTSLRVLGLGKRRTPGPSSLCPPGSPWQPDSDHTTNFAVLENDGLSSFSSDPS